MADHSACACGTVCQMQWSATPGPHKGLSPLLSSSPFAPVTSATRQSCHLQKFSDETAVVGCISKGEEAEYRAVVVVDNFVTWCEVNHLQLNTTKTKELVVDLRRTRTPATPVSILGHNVEIIEQ